MINNKNNFVEETDELINNTKGCGNEVDEELIKEKFDEFGDLLRDHDGRLKSLEISWAKQEESLANVKQGQEYLKKSMDKIESQMLTNHNAMLTGLNSLIINKQDNIAKVEVAKIDGKSKVYIQIILFFGGLATVGGSVYMAMK